MTPPRSKLPPTGIRQLPWPSSIAALLLLLLPGGAGRSVAGEPPAQPSVVATYECASVYWKSENRGACRVQYRPAGAGAWQDALDLIHDAQEGEYRGSLVGLEPGAKYEVRLEAAGRTGMLALETRSDQFPIGRTTLLPAGESAKPVVITTSGTAEAYHLVTVPAGARSSINVANSAPNGIEIDADYVIVRGIEVRNAAHNGILIRKDRHDVVVEGCRLWHWGRMGGAASFGHNGGNQDSGIQAEPGTFNLTLQRNLIENPRGASNDWETGHPLGPQGITLRSSRGGHVIRYNEIWSTEDHGFNDGIGGGVNFSDVGNMNRDSDIYGNIIRNAWDDAIECEGANMNVRIWGNLLEKYFVGIATAATAKGPLYLFRNVFGESRWSHADPRGNVAFKTQERGGFGGGPIFAFHNTVLQPRGPSSVFNNLTRNTVTRNNIFDVPGSYINRHDVDPSSDHDFDLFTGMERSGATLPHGFFGPRPAYVASAGNEFYPASTTLTRGANKVAMVVSGVEKIVTDPIIQVPNAALDNGERLPGFNDHFTGKAPDLGAFEAAAPPLQFGRRANLRHDEGWAPWERY